MLFLLIGNNRPTEQGVTYIGSNSSTEGLRERSLRLHNGGMKEKPLSSNTVNGIKRFVFVISYQESGRSVVGTLIDAHPHTLIAERDNSTDPLPVSKSPLAIGKHWKESLFNHLYKRSSRRSTEAEPSGHTAGTGYDWQGRYDSYIDVIGKESQGSLLASYLQNRAEFVNKYLTLQRALAIPVNIIHLLRNPFDIVPTASATLEGNVVHIRNSLVHKLDPNSKSNISITRSDIMSGTLLEQKIRATFQQLKAIATLTEDVFGRGNVLDIHHCDLVADPTGTASKIFKFLEVATTEQLLDECAEMISKSAPNTRPRDTVAWTPELKQAVERGMRGYRFLDRYSFTSD